MDSIADKFSVFDYFNLLIGGFVFLLGIGISGYPDSAELIKNWSAAIGESSFLLILSIASLIAGSFVIGIIINEISSWYFKTRRGFEKNKIENCLSNPNVIDNIQKLNRYKKKANMYFFSIDKEKDTYDQIECSTFFAHCVYYIQVRNKNEKTERLREVEGLSMLLSGTFVLIPFASVFIGALTNTIYHNICIKLLIYIFSIAFALVFYNKYQSDILNRIRMVFAVYDACVDMEINNNR